MPSRSPRSSFPAAAEGRQDGKGGAEGASGTEVPGSLPPLQPAPSLSRPKGTARRQGPSWYRRLRVVAEIALAAGAVFALYTQRTKLTQAGSLLSSVQIPWLVAAVAAQAGSMVVFARLQRWLLKAGGVDPGLGTMVEITLAGNAMSVSLPGGAAWAATWAFEQLRRRGAKRDLAVWVILVAGAMASFALFTVLVVGAWVAGNRGLARDFRIPGACLAAVPVAGFVIYRLGRRLPVVQRALDGAGRRLRESMPFGEKVVRALGSLLARLRRVNPGPLELVVAFALAFLNWLLDAATLTFAILALGIHVPWQGLLVAYGLAQLSASIPITPGGIGVVEGSLSLALIAYGVPGSEAVAATLLYRIVSFWGLVPVGWAVWVALEVAQRRSGGRAGKHHPWAWHHAHLGSHVPPGSHVPGGADHEDSGDRGSGDGAALPDGEGQRPAEAGHSDDQPGDVVGHQAALEASDQLDQAGAGLEAPAQEG